VSRRVFARQLLRGKDSLFWKGGEITLAITKKHKNELIAQYSQWVGQSKCVVVTEYMGLTMKEFDVLRAKVRDAGGEFHVVKNTLFTRTLEAAGMSAPAAEFVKSTAVAFAFSDAPAIAKIMTDFARTNEFVKVKSGYLDKQHISPEGVKALADLPPLPVMRAQLLGTIMAPASKLVRTLAEPGRMIAAVIKAHAEPEASPA
jgi:large subunit ribosomal protein L10